MAEVPPRVIEAAAAFGLDTARLRPLGGHSGSAWDAGHSVLRIGHRLRMDAELLAAGAAASAVPVPRLIGRAELGDMTAVLLERLPGQPAASVASGTPALARAVGLACGAVHARLAAVAAPAGLPPAPGTAGGRATARVLHLDLHPFNVLVADSAEVTGVLDWANAAAGDPVLDRARSWAILHLDPAALARREPGWRALTDGWAESGALHDIPPQARAWACRFMLADLGRRYSAGDLAHVREALRQVTGD